MFSRTFKSPKRIQIRLFSFSFCIFIMMSVRSYISAINFVSATNKTDGQRYKTKTKKMW